MVHTTPAHKELIALAPGVLTSHHAHHYRGFANTQWRLFEKTAELKPLLYAFRALLTGIHLMRSAEVQAHLPTLLAEVPEAPGFLADLIEAKVAAEHGAYRGPAVGGVREHFEALHGVLDAAQEASGLPEHGSAYDALDEFVVRRRALEG